MNIIDKINRSRYSLKEIFTTLARRPKLFVITTLFFFTGTVGFTIYQRLRNPVYRGNFAILIADPIGTERLASDTLGGFETLATNQTKNDVGLLKLFLRSPYVLQSLADELNISHGFLAKSIEIKGRGGPYKDTGDILEVQLSLKDKKFGEIIIKRLSEFYLDLSVELRL